MILQWMPWLAALLCLAGLMAAGMFYRSGEAHHREWQRVLLWTSTGMAGATFLVLIVAFILVRVEIEYVFLYTSNTVPLRYRIAGAWAGREGSLALWSLYAVLVAAAVTQWHTGKERTRSRTWTEIILALIAAAFLIATAWADLFAATSDFFLRNRPEGNGLNPTLRSPFILIHPPVMFMAYALTAVPLAAVFSHLLTGDGQWSRISLWPSRIDWLLYTFAMGLGGIWAYYTLGFGGYWAWDPVEVANLLPWLALTLFLHTQLHHKRHGRYAIMGPLLGILPFLFTLFSTISTRSGLWVSVHAFTDPTQTFNPDAGARFLDILAVEEGLGFYVGLFLAVLFSFLALWVRRTALDAGKDGTWARVTSVIFAALAAYAAVAPRSAMSLILEASSYAGLGDPGLGLILLTAAAILIPAWPLLMQNDEGNALRRLDMPALGFISILVLSTGLVVLLMFHMNAVNGWTEAFYLERFPFIAAPVLWGLGIMLGKDIVGRKNIGFLAGALILGTFLAGVMVDRGWAVIAPALAVTLLGLERMRRAATPRNLPPRIQAAKAMLWLAALLNVLFWLNPPSQIGLGPFAMEPVWPSQLFFGGLAFFALHHAGRILAGGTKHMMATHVLVGLLGGFYVAPLLAIASWWLHHGHETGVANPSKRLRAYGLYGIHVVLVVAILGYGMTAYLGQEESIEVRLDQSIDAAGLNVTMLGSTQTLQGNAAETIHPLIRYDDRVLQGILYYEFQTGSYYPLPTTERLWDRDLYLAIDAICVDDTGTCDDEGDWIQAYEPGPRLPANIPVTAAQIQVFNLPGLGLVWTALFGLLFFMGQHMAYGPERP